MALSIENNVITTCTVYIFLKHGYLSDNAHKNQKY